MNNIDSNMNTTKPITPTPTMIDVFQNLDDNMKLLMELNKISMDLLSNLAPGKSKINDSHDKTVQPDRPLTLPEIIDDKLNDYQVYMINIANDIKQIKNIIGLKNTPLIDG